MSIQYPKPKGGISPASPSRIHIYRDPPKAITTRKYEPINVGDIMYMVRADAEQGGDASRINEGIQYYARGQNSMVEVDYGNHSAGSMNTSLHNGQASNPYKIEVVRPPLYPVETLVPLSAPRIHQNYSIATNPFIAPVNIASGIDQTEVTNAIVKDVVGGTIKVNPSLDYYQIVEQLSREAKTRSEDITLRGNIRPTSSYSIDNTRENNNLRSTAVQSLNVYTVTANAGGDFKNTNNISMREVLAEGSIQNSLNAPAYSNVSGNTINNISMREELAKGTTQNSLNAPAYSNVSGNTINNISMREELAKGTTQNSLNAPAYSNVGNSGITMNNLSHNAISANAIQDLQHYNITSNANFGNIVVFDPKTNTTIDLKSTVKDKHYISMQAALGKPLTLHTNNGVPIHLKDYSYSVVQSNVGNTQFIIQVNQPDVTLERNTPLYTASSNASNNLGDYSSMTRGLQEQYHFDKMGSFGDYSDRVSKPNPNIRMQTGLNLNKKEGFRQATQQAHNMNFARKVSN
jgi:hypothetical protein